MGRPPRCNPCCRGYTPSTLSLFAVAGLADIGGGSQQIKPWIDEYAPDAATWSARTDMGVAGRAQSIGRYGSTALAFGRPATQKRTDGYSKPADSWSTLTSSTNTCELGGVTSIGANSYVVDFASGAVVHEVYSATGDSWAALSGVAVAEFNQSLTDDGTNCFTVGGSTSAFVTVASCRKYTVSGDSWSSVTSLPAPTRRYSCLFPSGDTITSAYGESRPSGSVVIRDTDQYSIAGDTWSAKTIGVLPGRTHSAWATISGKGYTAMGQSDGGSTIIQDNDIYDIGTDAWSGGTSTSSSRARRVTGGAAV